MWRDAEITTHDFTALTLHGLKTETLLSLVTALTSELVTLVEIGSDPSRRNDLRAHVASELLPALQSAEPGSDIQLQLARCFAALSITQEQIDFVRTMLNGGVAGLIVDRDLSWFFIIVLAERGEITRAELDAALSKDPTFTGELSHAQAVAALPDPVIKAETWTALIGDEISTSKREALSAGFMRTRQVELLAAYVDPYFDSLLGIWNRASYEMASSAVKSLYPRFVVAQSTLDKTDAWLNGAGKDAHETLRRLVSEGRDSLARTLRIQTKDQI
jgi:aminopeptidase N